MVETLTSMCDANQKAVLRDQLYLKSKYPTGYFVAYHHGEIIADSNSFDRLFESLKGYQPDEVLVERVGDPDDELVVVLPG